MSDANDYELISAGAHIDAVRTSSSLRIFCHPNGRNFTTVVASARNPFHSSCEEVVEKSNESVSFDGDLDV